jgi:hypothetical protein
MTPGIHYLPADAYHADPCPVPSLSASIAQILCERSPAHAWQAHPRLNKDYEPEEATRLDIGSAAHAIFLERRPELLAIIDASDWRTKAARESRDLARSEGKIPVLAHQAEVIVKMSERLNREMRRHPELAPVFDRCVPERTLVWHEAETWCRARLDLLSRDNDYILDYKTTGGNAEPGYWGSKPLYDSGCDIQAAFYTRGLQVLTGKRARFAFIVQETEPPYEVAFVGVPPMMLELGAAKMAYALRLWQSSMTSGQWPGYPQEICYLDPPTSQLARWEEREIQSTARR